MPIFNERVLLLILSLIQVTNVLDFVIMMPLGPQLIRVLNISTAQFGFAVSAYTWASALGGIAGAFFLDRFDRKKSLLICYIGLLFGSLVCGVSRDYAHLVFGRILAGVFGGLVTTSVFAMIGDLFAYEKRGRASGIVMSSFSISSTLGVPLSLLLVKYTYWYMPFLVICSIGVFVMIAAYFYCPSVTVHLKSNGEPQETTFHEFIEILKDNSCQRAFVFSFSLFLAAFTMIPFVSTVAVKNLGMTESQVAYIYLLGGVVTFFTSRLIGRLSDRDGKQIWFKKIAWFSIIPLLLISHIKVVPLPLLLFVTTLFMFSMSGRFVPATALMTSAAAANRRGAFISLNSSVQSVSAGLATMIGGLLMVQAADGHIERFYLNGYFSVFFTLTSIYLVSKLRVTS